MAKALGHRHFQSNKLVLVTSGVIAQPNWGKTTWTWTSEKPKASVRVATLQFQKHHRLFPIFQELGSDHIAPCVGATHASPGREWKHSLQWQCLAFVGMCWNHITSGAVPNTHPEIPESDSFHQASSHSTTSPDESEPSANLKSRCRAQVQSHWSANSYERSSVYAILLMDKILHQFRYSHELQCFDHPICYRICPWTDNFTTRCHLSPRLTRRVHTQLRSSSSTSLCNNDASPRKSRVPLKQESQW